MNLVSDNYVDSASEMADCVKSKITNRTVGAKPGRLE